MIENPRDVYTEKVIYWIRYHAYSKSHWQTVAQEVLGEVSGDMTEALPRLSFAIRAFHLKYQDAVIKAGNVLHDLVSIGYIEVDWDKVAQSVFDDMAAES